MPKYKQILSIHEAKYSDDLDLLGGKGHGLKQMTKLGIPVPPGFILTTKAWKDYFSTDSLSQEIRLSIREHVLKVERKLRRGFANNIFETPLLFSVRSGAKFSMPGMMDTILNVGITKQDIKKLAKHLGGEIYAYDTYRRFVKLFASCVFDIHQGEFDRLDDEISPEGIFTLNDQKKLITKYEVFIHKTTGKTIPQNSYNQLDMAISAVFDSWQNPSAIAYRKINGIPDDLGTAVVVQSMVFGNLENSCTGVLFTRNTETGVDEYFGDFMLKAQGEDIVRGASSRASLPISEISKHFPKESQELFKYAKTLEEHFKDAQDIEFTIEKGKVWLLQTRSAKRSPLANIRIARDMLAEGLISRDIALSRIKPSDIELISRPSFVASEEELAKAKTIGKGETASAGIAVGKLATTIEEVNTNSSKNLDTIYVCDHIDPNDIATLVKVKGVITTKGSSSSHMAIIMRSLGLPGIIGCKDFQIDENQVIHTENGTLKSGETLSINATSGDIYRCRIQAKLNRKTPNELVDIIKLKEEIYGKSPWSAAQYHELINFDYKGLCQRIKTISAASQEKWRSQKAQVIEILNSLLSEKQTFNNRVIRPNDIDSIKNALRETLSKGFFNAPRTCHFPEKLSGAPWADGPNNENEIEDFINNPDYPGKYGGLPKWVEDKSLDAVIVSSEPKGKINPLLARKHFVCTLTCINSNPASIVMNIVLGTGHLRTLERVESSDLIIVKTAINPKFAYELGHTTYLFGENMFDKSKLLTLIKKIHDLVLNPTLPHRNRKIVRLIHQLHIIFPNADLANLSETTLRKYLTELMVRNAFQEELYDLVVSKTTLGILEQITHKVFVDWWRTPTTLPYLMSALDDTLGLSVLEIQGRTSGNKLVWMKIYGAKGAEEKRNVQLWKMNKE